MIARGPFLLTVFGLCTDGVADNRQRSVRRCTWEGGIMPGPARCQRHCRPALTGKRAFAALSAAIAWPV